MGLELPSDGIEVSRIEHSGERRVTIFNHGSEPAPLSIRFTGPAVNPYLCNTTTGEMVRVSKRLASDEWLEIETTPGARQVRLSKNGSLYNGMHYLDLRSASFARRRRECD